MSQNNEDVRYVYDSDIKDVFYGDNNNDNEIKPTVKVKKGVKIALISVAIVVVVVVGIVLKYQIAENNKTIKFNKACINVKIDGYDTTGKVIVTPNYNEIKKVAMPVFEKKYGDAAEEMFQKFYSEIEIVSDMNTQLKNGDKVKISINIVDECLEELNINVSNTEYVEIVEGLEEVVIANPFAYMDVYVRENVSLFETAPIYCVYQNDEVLELSIDDFYFGTKATMDEGKVYEIGLTESAIIRATNNGKILLQTEYTVKIDDIDDVLLTSFDSISTYALFLAKTTADKKIHDLYDKATEFSMDECEYYGGWIISNASYTEGNELSLIFQVKTSHNEGLAEQVTTYIRVSFTDVVKNNDEVIIAGDTSIEADIYIVDNGVLMGYGNEGYFEYLSNSLFSSDNVRISFDEDGRINQY